MKVDVIGRLLGAVCQCKWHPNQELQDNAFKNTPSKMLSLSVANKPNLGFHPENPGDWQSRHLNNVSKERNGSQRHHRRQKLSPGALQLPTAHVKPSRLSLF
jgi:hypothetical protein